MNTFDSGGLCIIHPAYIDCENPVPKPLLGKSQAKDLLIPPPQAKTSARRVYTSTVSIYHFHTLVKVHHSGDRIRQLSSSGILTADSFNPCPSKLSIGSGDARSRGDSPNVGAMQVRQNSYLRSEEFSSARLGVRDSLFSVREG